MLDQFVKLTGYNRKYAARLLSQKEGAQATAVANGKTAVFKPEKKARPKNMRGKPVYTKETAGALEKIRAFYDGKCGPAFGPYLSVMIRQNIDAPVSSRKSDFHITPEIRGQLLCISGRQTGRTLKPVKDARRLRGISGTKNARFLPNGHGRMAIRRHCGDRDSGQFNLRLTITDVFSHMDLALRPPQQGSPPGPRKFTALIPNEHIQNP
jgi:hypothetical protein